MASCSWKNVGIDIADIVYDLMIEMLQKRGHL